jgi:hypothetical protein
VIADDACLVRVLVMGVWVMGMLMRHGLVAMPVDMWLFFILITGVLVLVVVVVHMGMCVLHGLMRVNMIMAFGEVQPNP